jgi:hypothetical protein
VSFLISSKSILSTRTFALNKKNDLKIDYLNKRIPVIYEQEFIKKDSTKKLLDFPERA